MIKKTIGLHHTQYIYISYVIVIITAVTYYSFTRSPWLDELTSLYFSQHINGLIDRYKGDPHPILYYLLLLPFSTFADNIGIQRLGPLALTFFICFIGYHKIVKRKNKEPFSLIILAICSSFIGLYSAFDVRMYGVLSVLTLTVSLVYYNVNHCKIEKNHIFYQIVVLLALLSSIHVWGGIIAVVYGLFFAASSSRFLSAKRLIIASCIFLVINLAGYYYGVLYKDISAWKSVSFDLNRYFDYLEQGISSNPYIILVYVVLYLTSLTSKKKSTIYCFDVPAVIVLFICGFISLYISIIKTYTITPCLSLLFLGTIIRLREKHKFLFFALIITSLTNLYFSHPALVNEKQNWKSSTSFALELDKNNYDCGTLAFPTARNLFHTKYFLGDENLLPLNMNSVENCQCNKGIFITNHISPKRGVEILDSLKVDYKILMREKRSLVGEYICLDNKN